MTNPSTSSPPATTSTGQVNLNSDGDRKSVSHHNGRKRDKIISFFRSAKADGTVKTQAARPETNIQHIRSDSIKAGGPIMYSYQTSKICSSLGTGTQSTTKATKARSDIFTVNVNTSAASIEAPKIGTRIRGTSQFALRNSLLLQSQGVKEQGVQGEIKGASYDIMPVNQTHLEWLNAIKDDTVEQHHICWLGTRMVEEFCKDAVKDSVAIAEVVFLRPFLGCEHYRKLLNCFISEFGKAKMLDVHLLQGLIQLVQDAPEGYLVADDLVRILSILRVQLQNTHQQSAEHLYHLTLAVSRLLDVMAEHKVQDVKRVEEHEPLSQILSGLRGSLDPFLMYQASYAYQALQYVPDDETALQAVLRHSAVVADSLVKISGVLKMDLGSVLDGLKGFQGALSSTYDTAKSGYEGVHSLMECGRGAFDSLKEGFALGHKRLWYPALRAADGFLRLGQLEDLNRLIVEAPCRRNPLFQWGICQLLAGIASDEIWEVTTRQQAIDHLVDLYKNDMEWAQDQSVKDWMLSIIVQLGQTLDPSIKTHANHLLDDLEKHACSANSLPYPLKVRLTAPKLSPLLARVQEMPYLEYKLHHFKRQRHQERTSQFTSPLWPNQAFRLQTATRSL